MDPLGILQFIEGVFIKIFGLLNWTNNIINCHTKESFLRPKHSPCPHESASNWQLPLSDRWEEIINWFSQLHVQSSELLTKCFKLYPFWPRVPLILPSHWIPDMLGGIFAKNCIQDWSVNSFEVSFNFNATNCWAPSHVREWAPYALGPSHLH